MWGTKHNNIWWKNLFGWLEMGRRVFHLSTWHLLFSLERDIKVYNVHTMRCQPTQSTYLNQQYKTGRIKHLALRIHCSRAKWQSTKLLLKTHTADVQPPLQELFMKACVRADSCNEEDRVLTDVLVRSATFCSSMWNTYDRHRSRNV